MDRINKYTPRVQKNTLLFIAGIVWAFAGFKVLSLGIVDAISSNKNWITTLVISSFIFYIFYKFIFSKIYIKHTKRIINSTLEKHCAFSFFDFKSYMIMGIMMFLGISVRSAGLFNPWYVSIFYIGLGFALFMAGMLFIISSIKFENTKLKYIN